MGFFAFDDPAASSETNTTKLNIAILLSQPITLQGNNLQTQVEVTTIGKSENITLFCFVNSNSIEGNFTPQFATSNFTATLSIYVAQSTPAGNYSITVLASDGETLASDSRIISVFDPDIRVITPTPSPIAKPTNTPQPSPAVTRTPNPTPTPTPTPTPSPTPPPDLPNQEPIEAFLNPHISPSGLKTPYPNYDYAEYLPDYGHNGHPSIHVLPSTNRWLNVGEVDGAWITVQPGDHIVCGGWVKTGQFNATDYQAGAGWGFDFFGHSDGHYGILSSSAETQAGHPTPLEKAYGNPNAIGYTVNGEGGLNQTSGLISKVPFNQDWTLVQWDFYVPNTYYPYMWGDIGVSQITPVQIDSIVMWTWVFDNGEAWFSDPYMYILPN